MTISTCSSASPTRKRRRPPSRKPRKFERCRLGRRRSRRNTSAIVSTSSSIRKESWSAPSAGNSRDDGVDGGATAPHPDPLPAKSGRGGEGRERCPQGALDARASACDNGHVESSLVKAVGFVHLHVHSAYSLREGALTIDTLAKLAKADQMPALAIGDTNNLFGALEFSEKLAKSGVQPIIGAQITIDFADAPGGTSRLADQRFQRAPIVLIAKDERGYLNLMRLASAVWLDTNDGDEPHVSFDA